MESGAAGSGAWCKRCKRCLAKIGFEGAKGIWGNSTDAPQLWWVKTRNFASKTGKIASKTRNFALKTRNFALKPWDISGATQDDWDMSICSPWRDTTGVMNFVFKNDGFCILNDEFCIKNEQSLGLVVWVWHLLPLTSSSNRRGIPLISSSNRRGVPLISSSNRRGIPLGQRLTRRPDRISWTRLPLLALRNYRICGKQCNTNHKIDWTGIRLRDCLSTCLCE